MALVRFRRRISKELGFCSYGMDGEKEAIHLMVGGGTLSKKEGEGPPHVTCVVLKKNGKRMHADHSAGVV